MPAARTEAGLGPRLAWRAMVAWRALLAVVGGYGVGVLLSAVLAVGLQDLGVSRYEATTAGVLAGLLVMPFAPVVAFGLRRTRDATAVIVGAAAALATVLLLVRLT